MSRCYTVPVQLPARPETRRRSVTRNASENRATGTGTVAHATTKKAGAKARREEGAEVP
jgi:hypothetical protein